MGEHFILKKSKLTQDGLERKQCLDFSDKEVKLNYAKIKIIISCVIGILYALCYEIIVIITWKKEQ